MVDIIYVARHGLRANHDPPPTGIDGDPRLTDEGDRQAQELGAFVSDSKNLDGDEITAIYSSPFYRCLQTATPASKGLSIPIWVETGIGEYYTTTRPTKPVPWPAQRSKAIFDTIDLSYKPQVSVSRDGETRQSLNERISKALDAIIAHADSHGHKKILLVTHAAVKIVIGEVLSGLTVRAGTCSLDKYVYAPHSGKPWTCAIAGETKFLSGGEQMHWSFDMAYEAGSVADEASRKQEQQSQEHKQPTKTSLISLDTSSLPESEQPATLDPSQMVFTKLDTDRPVIQIGSKIYEGEWQRIVGTEVFTSSSGEALGSAKYRIKLFPAKIEPPQRDRRPLVERLDDVRNDNQEEQK